MDQGASPGLSASFSQSSNTLPKAKQPAQGRRPPPQDQNIPRQNQNIFLQKTSGKPVSCSPGL
jgi:hypothetical protein